MSGGDALRRFMFEDFPVRGQLVRLEDSWREVLARQEYPPAVRSLLGEAMAACVLLASTLKFDGLLTMQIQGEGVLSLLVVQCSSDLAVRGLAKWEGDDPQGSLAELTGHGRLAITIERRSGRERYQGIVLADTDTLASCLDGYFAQSEQLPTRLWLAADGSGAAGMLLQQLPVGESRAEEDTDGDADGWQRVGLLGDTLTAEELLGLEPRQLLRRLFHEDDLRLADERAVSFRCSCTRDRVESALRLLGRDELDELLAGEGRIEVRCEFCNAAYELDRVDVARLLADQDAVPPQSDRLH
ncbi:Hsp33 family molecular chaperone HslO [Thioalkalivibrio sp. XN279]|uniref:Hsp33 family molecular chaperone HslO n=1 Tax=Thioalkalivibrio sp. XN279 TaxID=2714953 RepID=UPI0014098831|nr:Hsp33 family molecular chaperone HslO [Thioalkalivibrio sp. XN279]NHA15029.1 Hsp33 family molecular chaperone HslO [Thioalkalivibrio sp. XN279]